MSSRLPLTLFIVFLCVFIGGMIFSYKLISGFPLLPHDKVNSWHIELGLTLEKSTDNIELRVPLPNQNNDLKIVEYHITDNGFGDYIDYSKENPYLIWSKKNPDAKERLYYRAIVYKVRSADTSKENYTPLSLQTRSEKLNDDASILSLENIREKLTQESASDFNFITGLQQLLREGNDPDVRFIQAKLGNADKVTVAVEILNYSNIPARSVNGVLLSSARRSAKILRWVEADTETQKISFSPSRNVVGMPSNILPWWHGDKGLVTFHNSKATVTKDIAVKRHTESALTEAIWSGNDIKETLYGLTIYALPVELQVMMRILLLIPLGALVCIVIKQMVGIKTFGTFMPVLLAMAFRETSLINGIMLFIGLVGAGSIFRLVFDKMRLLTVPRLGAILTIIVLCVFLLALALDGIGIQASGLSLFPLVILTMMVERISVTWDEAGAQEAIVTTMTTLFVASICYFVLVMPVIEHIFTTFPELLLIIVGLMLMIGRYNGYKVTEYYRFRAMRK